MNYMLMPRPELFYEKKLSSLPALIRALRTLDEDSGVRIIGELGGTKRLAFITRFGPRYTMMTFSVKKGTAGPAERMETIETESLAVLEGAIRRVSPRRVRAFVY